MQQTAKVLQTRHTSTWCTAGRRLPVAARCRADTNTTDGPATTAATTIASRNSLPSSNTAAEDPVRQAYLAGYRAGYAAGAKVTVNVTVGAGPGKKAVASPIEKDEGASAQEPAAEAASNAAAASAATPSASAESGDGQKPQPAEAAPKGQDSLARSAVKALVWRLFSTVLTVSVALIVLQDNLEVKDALKFGGIEFTIKYITYFLHERLWTLLPSLL